MQKLIKFVLAILLLICLFDLPYGYYQIVRVIATIAFVYLSIFDKNKNYLLFIYIGLAILFQPIFKISLGRELWNFVDVAVAIWLIFETFNKSKINSNDTN